MIGTHSLSLPLNNTSSSSSNDSPAQITSLLPNPVGISEANRDTIFKSIQLLPITFTIAKRIIVSHHYLHSMPGGTELAFGVFSGNTLLGAITLGAGPFLAYQMVEGATPDDCLTLTRLWLADELPRNSESHVIGFITRSLHRHTQLKFLISYSDPSQGHVGTIYQATNWLYTGVSEPMPLYDLGDGKLYHSRSLAHTYGTHSLGYLASRGIYVKVIPQAGKHRYIYFIDSAWRSRLRVPVLQYPKRGQQQ